MTITSSRWLRLSRADADAVNQALAETALQAHAHGRVDDRAHQREERNEPQVARRLRGERGQLMCSVLQFHGDSRCLFLERGGLRRVDIARHLVEGEDDG